MSNESLRNNGGEGLDNSITEESQPQPESFSEHMEKREEEILDQLKQIHPIEKKPGSRQTKLNPLTVAKTFNIPVEMATRIAERYNEEVKESSWS